MPNSANDTAAALTSRSGARDLSESPLEILPENALLHAALRESERRLRQVQKMEAMGRLAGGMVHDFNNLLGITLVNLEVLGEEIDRPALRELASRAIGAVKQGIRLAGGLRACMRDPPHAPASVDVNSLVGDLVSLLRRAFPDTIVIEFLAWPGLWTCCVDPGQLWNALINLALNGRDAMADGGMLTIKSANVALGQTGAALSAVPPAGNYVMLTVSDTGCGMTPEILSKACESYFTTKAAGGGTGLGLPSVQNFVHQHGGHLRLASEPRQGTTIALYLPRGDADGTVGEEMGTISPHNELGRSLG